MEDERDYYAILGVPADAPDVEIRRAFRARAKELHPDSKPASERDQAHREFNFLSEAYDTLKDAERRAAYDEELRHSRQLTRVETKGKPPGAFAMGLAFGLLLAGAGIGAKLFLDAGRGTRKEPGFPESYQNRADTGSSARSVGKNGPGRARQCDGSLPGGRWQLALGAGA